MCFEFHQSVERITEDTVEEFIKKGEPFTAYDVSKEVHEKIRYNNIKTLVHETIKSYDEVEQTYSVRTNESGTHNVVEYLSKDNQAGVYDDVGKHTSAFTISDNSPPAFPQILASWAVPDNNVVTTTGGSIRGPQLSVNKGNRLIVPKKYLQAIRVKPSHTIGLHKLPNKQIQISNHGQGKPLMVDTKGFLSIRSGHLDSDHYNVEVKGSAIQLTPTS